MWGVYMYLFTGEKDFISVFHKKKKIEERPSEEKRRKHFQYIPITFEMIQRKEFC